MPPGKGAIRLLSLPRRVQAGGGAEGETGRLPLGRSRGAQAEGEIDLSPSTPRPFALRPLSPRSASAYSDLPHAEIVDMRQDCAPVTGACSAGRGRPFCDTCWLKNNRRSCTLTGEAVQVLLCAGIAVMWKNAHAARCR